MKKRTLIEWLVIISIILVFAFTGWHRPLMVQLQRAIIFTGLLAPDTTEPPVVSNLGIYDLKVRDESGRIVMLSEFQGKLVFINFWATWCPPCRAEMPGINSLYGKIQHNNLIYLILTTERDFNKAMAFRDQNNFNFPVYQLAGNLPSIYRDRAIPRSYVVSPEGELIMKHTGLADYDSRKFRDFLSEAIPRAN